jgi:thiol-disulfide isomerase/thioredoxin
MKKIVFLLVAIAMLGCGGPSTNTVTISGMVSNPTADEVEVFYYTDFLMNKTETVMVKLDQDNGFSTNLPLESGQFVYVRLPRRTVMVYLLPGASVHLAFDAENPDAKAVATGDMAYESKFMIDYHNESEREFARGLIISRLSDMSPDEFVQYMQTVSQKKHAYLDEYPDLGLLNTEFTDIIKTNIAYDTYTLLLEYPMYIAYFNPDKEPPVLPEGYYDFLGEATRFDDSRLVSRSYVGFLSSLLNYNVQKQGGDTDDEDAYFDMQYQIGVDSFDGRSRDFILSQVVISALNFGDFEKAQLMYDKYIAVAQDADYKSLVRKEFETILSLAKGNMAPDFTLTDIDGKVVSLSDFRGQVVYLDFWASWCGPCMREFPHAKELKEKLRHQKDLVFLYVSIDTDEHAWRTTVAAHEIQGVHVNVSGTKLGAPLLYNVKGVPTFYIIGRNGRIYDNRPPRPSNPAIYETLMAALLE